jgi:hypothetical protein
MTVKAFIPRGLLCLRRRYTPRLLTALCKMFAECGVKPLNPAAVSTPRFAATLAACGKRVEKPVFYAARSLLSKNSYTCCYAPFFLKIFEGLYAV